MTEPIDLPAQKKTARLTGLGYLTLALCGMVGFILVRPALYAPADPAMTLKQVSEHLSLARLGLAAELGTVVAQAVTAVLFYKLFRKVDAVAASATMAFGVVNATAILVSAAFLATALAVAQDTRLAPGGDAAATVQLMYVLSGNTWAVSATFFGLWLMPMGRAAIRSAAMPKALGWILIGGGVGYVVNAFAATSIAGLPRGVIDGITIPATIGEFWMIGFLLVLGWRPRSAGPS